MIPVTMATYETRRGLWLLPLGFLIWSNCHGGFIMGWAVAACYCAEALYHRLKGMPASDLGKICGISILAVLAEFLQSERIRRADCDAALSKQPVANACPRVELSRLVAA